MGHPCEVTIDAIHHADLVGVRPRGIRRKDGVGGLPEYLAMFRAKKNDSAW